MARGASSTGKGVRRAAPDRQARVGVQEWVWWGSARARGLDEGARGPSTRRLSCLVLLSINLITWISNFKQETKSNQHWLVRALPHHTHP